VNIRSNTLKRKVSDLPLSTRSVNALLSEIDTVGDLVKLTRGDLLKFTNMGKASVREIGEVLAAMGLKLTTLAEKRNRAVVKGLATNSELESTTASMEGLVTQLVDCGDRLGVALDNFSAKVSDERVVSAMESATKLTGALNRFDASVQDGTLKDIVAAIK